MTDGQHDGEVPTPRSSGGVEVTNELVQRLAAEAEAGHDVDPSLPHVKIPAKCGGKAPAGEEADGDGPAYPNLEWWLVKHPAMLRNVLERYEVRTLPHADPVMTVVCRRDHESGGPYVLVSATSVGDGPDGGCRLVQDGLDLARLLDDVLAHESSEHRPAPMSALVGTLIEIAASMRRAFSSPDTVADEDAAAPTKG